MSDTSPEMAARYRTRLQACSPAERVRMATGMFAAARALVIAEAERAGERTGNLRELLLDRFYGTDLSEEALAGARRRLLRDAPPEGRQPGRR